MDNFKFPTETDEFRPIYANVDEGGFDFASTKTMGIIRGIGTDLIKQIGKKIISGDFNLTTISIPIKVMVPISILQHVCNGHFNFPLYLNMASVLLEPLLLLCVFPLWHKLHVCSSLLASTVFPLSLTAEKHCYPLAV